MPKDGLKVNLEVEKFFFLLVPIMKNLQQDSIALKKVRYRNQMVIMQYYTYTRTCKITTILIHEIRILLIPSIGPKVVSV